MSITILKPGIMSSVQDLGRWGYQQYGVPIGGAMDKFSAALTNIICGNDENEGVIELTLHGSSVLFNEDSFCAFAGGGCKVLLMNRNYPLTDCFLFLHSLFCKQNHLQLAAEPILLWLEDLISENK